MPLLTREEEVAIAKEIEAGEREVREAVFSLDLAVSYVLNLGERLKRQEIDARHVFGDDEATTGGDTSEAAETGAARGQARRRLPEAREQAQAAGRRARRSSMPSAARRGRPRSARWPSTSASRSSPTERSRGPAGDQGRRQAHHQPGRDAEGGPAHRSTASRSRSGGSRSGSGIRAPRWSGTPPGSRPRRRTPSGRQPDVPCAGGAGSGGRRDHQGSAPAR